MSLDLPEERYLEYRDKIEERGNVPMEGYPEREKQKPVKNVVFT